ncbi:class I SAM-dependent methyltransferase [Georgfuchsia toluolica]|uniref:class I SAM-dependent methyltransferase n=1 Tax=Georgfuchsia toluolica TaxID=424218 RepID=UPI001C73CCEC|nr:class I SAM-dependent methyltransferase [Georgfuchsia toluolica]
MHGVDQASRNRRTKYLKGQYWGGLLGWVALINPKLAITLEKRNSGNSREFHIYGLRLLNVMMRRFEEHGGTPLGHSEILELGCGMGRYTLPLACRFQHVHAVDISKQILRAARKYCSSAPNISFYANDGHTLGSFADESIEYVLCTGVIQHIPDFDVIGGYVKEVLRVLKDGGLYLFTFQVHHTQATGSRRTGAKITAEALDRCLSEAPYEILEISNDPEDPVPHFLVLIRKNKSASAEKKSFANFPLTNHPYRTGVFEDLISCKDMIELWKKPQPRITFYDKESSGNATG